MTSALALDWFRELLWTAVLTSAPPMLTAVVVGLIVAIVQAATQINDASVAYAPKAIATVASLVIAGPWILLHLVRFTSEAFAAIARLHP